MEIKYEERTKWRRRGRPALDIPEEITRALLHTADTGQVAELPYDPQTTPQREIDQAVRVIRAAARNLHGRAHVQRDPRCLRFYLEFPGADDEEDRDDDDA
jgi:hypothetical protein